MGKWLGKGVPEFAIPGSEEFPSELASNAVADTGTPLFGESAKSAGAIVAEAPRQRKTSRADDISVLWHELLTPITLIKGYTSTLLQLNDTITPEQQMQYIQGIDSASNRLVRLLENLRDVTRLEETDIIRNQTISLLELLQKVLPEMQSQTLKHTIRLHPHAPLPRIKLDPEKIEQVVVNLVANAVKYTPDSGNIDVDVQIARSEPELGRFFEGAPALQVPCYVVSIADNGIGLTEDELERIFEKFYRANHKLVRTSPGAGLGLYICKIIVEAHGGHIWAVNRPEGGSIFSFSIPLNLPDQGSLCGATPKAACESR